MASLVQPNIFSTRDTSNAYTTSSHLRGPDTAHMSVRRGSAWSGIPNIWQHTPQDSSTHLPGAVAPVSPTRGDSLTAPKSPQDPPIPGPAGEYSSRSYPPRNANSSAAVVLAPSSAGRSSLITESPARQRAPGLLNAHTNSKMPHLSTATLLSGSAPDVDSRSPSTYSSSRTSSNRFQAINVGGIDEFVPGDQQGFNKALTINPRFAFELGPTLDQLGTTFNTSGYNFIGSLQNSNNNRSFGHHSNVQSVARPYSSVSSTHIGGTWGNQASQKTNAGTLAVNKSQGQSLSATFNNLQLSNGQQQYPYQTYDDAQGANHHHHHQQQHAAQEEFLHNNTGLNLSSVNSHMKGFETSTPQMSYANPVLNDNAFHYSKGRTGSAGTAVYTPSFTPPTAPGSRRSNSGSGASTRASSQSVDTRFGSFDANSAVFAGRQGGFQPPPTISCIDPYDHPINAFNTGFIAPQPGLQRPYEGHSQHPSSSEARIQQEKEQNLSPLIKEFRANYKTKRYELKDAYDHIVEFSGDQHGSRFIQAKLETANSEEKEKVFAEIQENALQLMTDIFGNYVIQKMFEHGTQAQKKILANQMKGRVYYLTTQVYGCRVVQKALEHVLTDQQASMVRELEGNVLGIVENQNGNHVIQKAIERVPSEHIQFIFDAHVGHVVRLSKHNYGCRVVQRILEYGPPAVKKVVLGELREAIPILIEDQFGNYVMQHIIRNGEPSDRRIVVTLIQQQLLHFSKHKFASNVVEAAIECAEDQQRQEILRSLTTGTDAQGQSQVYGLIRDQYGNYVIQKVLAVLQGAALNDLVVEIQRDLMNLRRISHGKQVSAMEKALSEAIVTLGSQYRGHGSSFRHADSEPQTRSPSFSGPLRRHNDQFHGSRPGQPHAR